ncbi:hypothetical protein [Paraburkholderia sp. Ac-20347]|uniref:hypothetical protein n=1 Tax=Paraburkholderia sp. Ac-20347 TaxID=2703892 RepID=UPI001F12407A|nr:hypothetical protein [Paraburkholderia sp. Ac-20347]
MKVIVGNRRILIEKEKHIAAAVDQKFDASVECTGNAAAIVIGNHVDALRGKARVQRGIRVRRIVDRDDHWTQRRQTEQMVGLLRARFEQRNQRSIFHERLPVKVTIRPPDARTAASSF